ncbi:MAG: hypothetical protein Q6J33_00315 [Gloeomargarita sp. DG_2_bins_126]
MTHSPRQPTIVHGVPGRLRIRIPSLQTSPDLKIALEAHIKATPAVETVRISAPTDCIIVNYCPQQPIQDNLYQQICQITQAFFAPAVAGTHPQAPPPVNPPPADGMAPNTASHDAPIPEVTVMENPVGDLAPKPTGVVPDPMPAPEPDSTSPVVTPPTPAKAPARRSPTGRKPRTRKKPEPPAPR